MKTTKMKNTKKLNKKVIIKYLFIISMIIYPMIMFVLFWVGVNANSLLMAFEERLIGPAGNIIRFNGFKNFKAFFDMCFQKGALLNIAMRNSIILYLVRLLFCLPLEIIFAYLIYKKCFLYKSLRFSLMIPQVLSSFIICMVFKRFIDYNGALPYLYNSLTGKILPNLLRDPATSLGTTIFYVIWIIFGTNVLVLSNAMKEVPDEVVESAQMDGVVGMFQELRYITLPIVYPTLVTLIITGIASIFSFAGANVEFYMYDAPKEVTNVGYFYLQQTMIQTSSFYPILSAGGLIMTLLVAPVTLLVRFLLEKFNPMEDKSIC